jgi:hypothetical protein
LEIKFTTNDWDEIFDLTRFTRNAREVAARLWDKK